MYFVPSTTPVPGRRFLPPSSSSSTTKSVDRSSARRNPFSSSRPAPVPSSSYPVATPRFQQSTQKTDDIQTSFDDEADSPLFNGRLTIASGASVDVVDDDERSPSPLYHRTGDLGVDSHCHAEDESSPLQQRQVAFAYTAKRRKVIHPGINVAELINDSSPSEDDRSDDVDHLSDAESPASSSELEDDLTSAVRRTPNEDSGRLSHFRSLASEPRRPGPSSKPAFRTNPEDISHGQVVSGPVLPDIFSPSRRKGKKDYIPGGTADLVRSWVLAIPTQESHGHGQSLSEEAVSITQIKTDSSGRFWLATDDNGAQWLLPLQQEKAGAGSLVSLSALRPGARILVKGQATKWRLNLDSCGSSTVTVAAYWEIVPPG
ncbi:hypothetical protein CLCR_03570 [Cladophialophora carrionii]|uniref:Uncharacterized protein n=1 Tax=Cladophialophora carrionii TaxID=86049 RepID=A0A1C1CH07_9EURO|nr:hypothetical protein CLCR_03570 [Cladophialophora carrionii]